MTILELRFPAGRYHATPWGRHVNEGAVEWPPSPWRILRAFIATWHLKAREIPEATLRSLVEKLSTPPRFGLPRASTSHTRHYMPLGNEKTTKVFDTFIQLEEGSVILVAWDAELAADESTALHTLAERLGYVGRAESLVIARVLESDAAFQAAKTPAHREAAPLNSTDPLPPGHELIRLLAPIASADYAAWRDDFMAKALTALGPKPTVAQKKKLPEVPADLFAALHADTGDLQAAGWNLPPGAAFVNYTRPENAFAPAPRPRATRKGPPLTVARYAITSTVAPSITQAISIGDRVHDALCKWSDQGKGRASVFTGLDADGKPLAAQHQHAHIFCEANGPRDSVTHITIWAKMGFDEEACLVLRRLNRVWGHGDHDIRLVLHGIGQASEFADCTLFGPAKRWRSLTPFVSTLHAKTFRDGRPKLDANGWQQGSAAHDLLRLLGKHPRGAGATIRHLDERSRPYRFGSQSLRSLQFQTRRHDGEGRRGNGSAGAFEISFTEHVTGPLALGYGAHFGLGLFTPVV
jgi:CRISPR-associated protein Csb2